mmetsp:Transcript_10515/g.19201  ORF Transcript_10515/g.19201 Transcript_10515/m.19201 type:complete len:247 (-) Transcript_10515:1349-2089(-)
MFHMKILPSSLTLTSCLSSGLNCKLVIFAECPPPLATSFDVYRSQIITVLSTPPVAMIGRLLATAIADPSPPLLHCITGAGLLRFQTETLLSWPTVMTDFWSGVRAMELMLPIGCLCSVIRLSFRRSQHRNDLSLLLDNTYLLLSYSARELTLSVCCLRWHTSCLVRTSHTRTSPFSPPLTINLRFLATESAVTPSLCAFGILKSTSPVSESNTRITPSLNPPTMISSVRTQEVTGMPVSILAFIL